MVLTVHKSRAIFDRYNIINEQELLWRPPRQPGRQVRRRVLATAGLVKGTSIGIDATTLEANAALRSIVRRDTGQAYQAFRAVKPVTRSAARNLLICHRAQGVWSWTRAPLGRSAGPKWW